jgi:hypothetical protein
MSLLKPSPFLCLVFASAIFAAGCASSGNTNNVTSVTKVPAPTASPSPQNLSVVDRPQKVKDMMTTRGDQDQASPVLKIVSPKQGETVNGSTVPVKLDLGGDLKGYKPMKDPSTGMGNHIHVILDNQPYEAYYDLSQPFELRNVTEGNHTLRVFPSRPWHESFKNDGAFQMVSFTVKGGGDASKPTTTNNGQTMANNSGSAPKAANTDAPAGAPHEGKDMANSTGGVVDLKKPLLTYSRPKGEYKGADADSIMIDFWLSNGKLQGDGGDYRVRYTVDGSTPQYIDKWAPIWLTGWNNGNHSVQLELVDKNGNVVDNGGYNSTTRNITVAK